MDEKRKKLLCDILAEADKMRIEKTWLVSEDELEEHSGIRDSYEFGFLCGYLLCKEKMMKDAVVAAVNTYEEIGGEGYVEFVANIPVGQYRKEMLVKLIIIKEE